MMRFGLIGEKLGHSYSPLIHQVFGIGDYALYPMPEDGVEKVLREKAFQGLNVTIPYKQKVLPFCDELSPTVKRIGSANTLVVREGRILAENTDLAGMLYMLNRGGISLRGKKVVILGSGGTSLTAREACRVQKARETVVVSRSGPVTYEKLYSGHTDAEILINATPVGMYPRNLQSPVDISRFPHLAGVADVIYNPARTALMAAAEEAGIPCVGGLWMLAAQGYYAAELFLNRKLSEEKIGEAWHAVRKQCLNLVLVGMPGCGKTTQGRRIAAETGRRFVDLDEEIERRYGPIPEIFAARGEQAFRDMESEIVREFGRESGCVIATGGGAVLRAENRTALRQNGVVAWLKRPAEQLDRQGRPLSTGMERLKQMEKERLPLYRECADFSAEVQEKAEETTRALMEGFDEAAGFERTESEHAGHPGKASVRHADL